MKLIKTVMIMFIVLPSVFLSAQQISIIPEPSSISLSAGHFELCKDTRIIADDKLIAKARQLADFLRPATGFDITSGQVSPGDNVIVIKLNQGPAKSSIESYELQVKPKAIIITANTQSGIFYGIQTLRQLLPPQIFSTTQFDGVKWTVPCCQITDNNRFQWRGLMIDISRHFFDKQVLKGIIDQMAAQKLNRLHLHLSDNEAWRVEIKSYPRLTTEGAKGCYSNSDAPIRFLSRKDVKELVRYARDRHILIIPEFDVPGHSAAVTRTYSELDGGHRTLNISSEDTSRFVKTVIKELQELFETDYIHVGGDEVRGHQWHKRDDMKAAVKKHNLKNVKELEAKFNCDVADYVVSIGVRPIGWDDTSDHNVNKNNIVQWWRCLQPNKRDEAIKNGYDMIISPPDYIYFDYPYVKGECGAHWEGMRNGGNSTELIYNWEPVPVGLSAIQEKQILGIEACLWSEFIDSPHLLEFMLYPRLSAVAEVAWASKGKKDWKNFEQKMALQLDRYKVQNINYRIPGLKKEERKKQQPEAYRKRLQKK